MEYIHRELDEWHDVWITRDMKTARGMNDAWPRVAMQLPRKQMIVAEHRLFKMCIHLRYRETRTQTLNGSAPSALCVN
jgi:hypothetical protein